MSSKLRALSSATRTTRSAARSGIRSRFFSVGATYSYPLLRYLDDTSAPLPSLGALGQPRLRPLNGDDSVARAWSKRPSRTSSRMSSESSTGVCLVSGAGGLVLAQPDVAQLGLGTDRVDRGDPAVAGGQHHHGDGLVLEGGDDARFAVDLRQQQVGARRATEQSQHALGHLPSPPPA